MNRATCESPTGKPAWLDALNPRVLVQRHGFSSALESDLVVSGLEHGRDPAYGLTEAGRKQVEENVEKAMRDGTLRGDALVVSSPFSRARETAAILCNLAGLPGFDEDPRLRERFFGEFDMGPAAANYRNVWAMDREDPTHTHHGVESLVAVTERLADFFEEWHATRSGPGKHENRNLVVVTHGDPALLIESLFRREDPRTFRDSRDLAPGTFIDLSRLDPQG